MKNEGPFRIALRGGNGGYSVVREPSEAQKVTAVLLGEPIPTPESHHNGPLSYREAHDMVLRLTKLAERNEASQFLNEIYR